MSPAKNDRAAASGQPSTQPAAVDPLSWPRHARHASHLRSHSKGSRFARRAFLSVTTFAFVLLPCTSSCTSPSRLVQERDTARAHELTLEALDVLDSDPATAEALLLAALKADPFHGPAHNDLGVLYYRRSELYQAANEFESARKLMPGDPGPRLNLGLTLEKAALFDRAFEAYNAALEVSPAHIRTIQAIARLTLRTGRKSDQLMGDQLMRMLEDITLRGETPLWRSWAQEQLSRLKR